MSPSPMPSMGSSHMMSPGASPMGSMGASPMSSDVGTMDPGMMAMSGPDLLPPWVTWLWLIALTAVLVFHCAHFIRMGGQHRWFHASHILMLVSMLYMYASMEFRWTWLSADAQAIVFGLSSAAILIWLITWVVQKQPFSYLWILALIMQVAMIYMWLPDWIPALTWALVVYYGLETLAWLFGLIDDTKGKGAIGPGDRSAFVPLAHPSLLGNASMAIMAASMGYMFAAMQVMR
ncbi:MAG: DUF5134 domain-containing protein [Actinobacteria bacterium]|nr:DUF5134 domain-containing protein [Actinomycetota bacterium]